jgi:hypothetical protein
MIENPKTAGMRSILEMFTMIELPCVFVDGHLADFGPFDDVGLVVVRAKKWRYLHSFYFYLDTESLDNEFLLMKHAKIVELLVCLKDHFSFKCKHLQ